MSFDNTMPSICILWMFFVGVQINVKCFLCFSFWILEGWYSWQKCPATSSESSSSPKNESMFCVPDLKEKFDAYYVCCCILFCDLDTFYDLPGEGTRPWYANKGELTKHLVYCTSFQVSNSKNVGGSWKFRFQNPVTSLELVYFYGKTHEIKKNSTRGGKTAPGIVFKKKTFSRRSRKPPNLCPTHTQRHRSSRKTRLTLDLCFGVG